MLHYSWPLVIVGFAGVINQYSSIAFQKYLLEDDLTSNLAEGGKYAAAASIAIILSLFTTAYNYAAEPFFFAHKEKQEARAVYADAPLAYTIIASLMMLIILAYLDVFQLLIGKNFRDTLEVDRKSTRLNSSHLVISYAVFCLKKKKKRKQMDE